MATMRASSASGRNPRNRTAAKTDSAARPGKVNTHSAKQQQQLLKRSRKLQEVRDERKKELGVG